MKGKPQQRRTNERAHITLPPDVWRIIHNEAQREADRVGGRYKSPGGRYNISAAIARLIRRLK